MAAGLAWLSRYEPASGPYDSHASAPHIGCCLPAAPHMPTERTAASRSVQLTTRPNRAPRWGFATSGSVLGSTFKPEHLFGTNTSARMDGRDIAAHAATTGLAHPLRRRATCRLSVITRVLETACNSEGTLFHQSQRRSAISGCGSPSDSDTRIETLRVAWAGRSVVPLRMATPDEFTARTATFSTASDKPAYVSSRRRPRPRGDKR